MGTGGAIKEACKSVEEKNVVVVNGDTLFAVDISNLSKFHEGHTADCTIALKQMHDFDRYGAVELKEQNLINAFKEKQFCATGLINGGVYALTVSDLKAGDYPEVFSFEKEYLEKNTGSKKLYGVVNDGYFIDIGIPEDYLRFQEDYREVIAKNGSSPAGNKADEFIKGLIA